MRAIIMVGWNVRRIRVASKLSQEKLAFDSGVDRSYVGGLERGEENPSVELLERLAQTLNVEVGQFFTPFPADAQRPEPLKGGRKPAE